MLSLSSSGHTVNESVFLHWLPFSNCFLKYRETKVVGFWIAPANSSMLLEKGSVVNFLAVLGSTEGAVPEPLRILIHGRGRCPVSM